MKIQSNARRAAVIVKIGVSRQVAIPKKLHDELGLAPGDYLQVELEGDRLILTPKALIEKRLAESLDDIREGRVHGPFRSTSALLRSLHRAKKSKASQMELFYTERFRRSYADAPLRVQKQCDKQLGLLAHDLRHPSLRAKKYDEARDIWQGRVNASWHFYFKIDGDSYYLLDIILHPKQINKSPALPPPKNGAPTSSESN